MSRYLLLLTAPFTMMFLYDLLFYWPSWASSNYEYLPLWKMILLLCGAPLFVLFFTKKILAIETPGALSLSIPKGRFRVLENSVPFMAIYLFCSMYFYAFEDLNFSYFIERMPLFYSSTKVGFAWTFYVYKVLIYVQLYLLYKDGFTRRRVASVVFTTAIFFLTGGRGLSFMLLFTLFFLLIIYYKMRIHKGVMVLTAFIFMSSFVGMSIYRSGHQKDIWGYLKGRAFTLDFNNSYVLNDTLWFLSHKKKHFLVALEDFKYALVPRVLLPEKPISSAETRLVYSYLLEDGRKTNITFGYYGNLILNFGFYLGTISIFFFLYLLAKLYGYYLKNIHRKTPANFLLMIFFTHFLLVLRGGIINSRIFLLFISISLSVFLVELLDRERAKYE